MVAGMCGGVALLLWGTLLRLVAEEPLWPEIKASTIPLLGAERALDPVYDPGAVALGMGVHFAVSVAWGLVFAGLFRGLSGAGTVVAGVLYGAVVWILMYWALPPLLDITALVRSVPIGWALTEHLVFGLALGLAFLPFQRTIRVHLTAPWDTDTGERG